QPRVQERALARRNDDLVRRQPAGQRVLLGERVLEGVDRRAPVEALPDRQRPHHPAPVVDDRDARHALPPSGRGPPPPPPRRRRRRRRSPSADGACCTGPAAARPWSRPLPPPPRGPPRSSPRRAFNRARRSSA